MRQISLKFHARFHDTLGREKQRKKSLRMSRWRFESLRTANRDSRHVKRRSRGSKRAVWANVPTFWFLVPSFRFLYPPLSFLSLFRGRVFWKRGLSEKSIFLEIPENLEILEILENLQTVGNKGESDRFLEILDNLENFEILDSGEKTPFVMTPFSGPDPGRQKLTN